MKNGVSLDERYGGDAGRKDVMSYSLHQFAYIIGLYEDKNMDEHCGTVSPYIKIGGRLRASRVCARPGRLSAASDQQATAIDGSSHDQGPCGGLY